VVRNEHGQSILDRRRHQTAHGERRPAPRDVIDRARPLVLERVDRLRPDVLAGGMDPLPATRQGDRQLEHVACLVAVQAL
jgi:hypothetical protein